MAALNYAQITGKRIFITPNIMTRNRFRPSPDSTRTYAVCIQSEYRQTDTVRLTIPAGYKPEALPKPVELKSAFGNYRAGVQLNGTTMVYTRVLEQLAGTHPASAYPDLVAFWEKVYKADRARLVMVKEEQ